MWVWLREERFEAALPLNQRAIKYVFICLYLPLLSVLLLLSSHPFFVWHVFFLPPSSLSYPHLPIILLSPPPHITLRASKPFLIPPSLPPSLPLLL